MLVTDVSDKDTGLDGSWIWPSTTILIVSNKRRLQSSQGIQEALLFEGKALTRSSDGQPSKMLR